MNDRTEGDIGPGDFASINPGHDAWVVGDEPFVGVDLRRARRTILAPSRRAQDIMSALAFS